MSETEREGNIESDRGGGGGGEGGGVAKGASGGETQGGGVSLRGTEGRYCE